MSSKSPSGRPGPRDAKESWARPRGEPDRALPTEREGASEPVPEGDAARRPMSERAPPRPPGHRASHSSGTRAAVALPVEPTADPGERPSDSDRPSAADRPSEDVVLPLVTERTGSPPPVAVAIGHVTGAHEIEPGRVIDGRYRIEELLGTGAVGLVYRCRHLVLDKPMAIKVLRPDFARDKEVSERLVVEAKAASSIGSPHIVETVDFGRLPDGSAFFVMEYLEGSSLGEIIESGSPLGGDEVLHIGIQIAEALAGAHAAGIIHRDLKPDNVFITARGNDSRFVKILDFGIAKLARAERRLTRAGQVYGTPHYMSPEQAAGRGTDARTDVYALGVILFEMITRRVPFDADEPMGILVQHLNEPPPPLAEVRPEGAPDVPGIELVIRKCLAKSPDERYADMHALKADLTRLQAGLAPEATAPPVSSKLPASLPPPSSAFTRGAYVLAVLGVLVSGLLAYALYLRGDEAVAVPSAPPPAEAVPAAVRAPAPAAETPNAEPPAADEGGREVLVVVIPQDARITRGKEELGTMPVTVRVKPGEKVHLGVRRKGFISRRLTLDGSRSKVVVGLVPRGAKPKSAAAAEAEADEAAKEAMRDEPIEGVPADPAAPGEQGDEAQEQPPAAASAAEPAPASAAQPAQPSSPPSEPSPAEPPASE